MTDMADWVGPVYGAQIREQIKREMANPSSFTDILDVSDIREVVTYYFDWVRS